MPARPSRSVRTVAVTLLVALQLLLQPAAVLAAAGVRGSMGVGGDCSGCCSAPIADLSSDCCSAPAVEIPSDCFCCGGGERDATPSDPGPDGIGVERHCDCAAPPASIPVAPGESFKGTAAASADTFMDPRIALPGVLEVERFGVHGTARARAPGLSRGLNVLHQVYRI